MALFRSFSSVPRLIRSCNRVVATQYQGARNYADMPLTFASPTEVFYKEQNVRQIDVSTIDSAMGILPTHVPTLGVLRPGVVRVYLEDQSTRDIFVSSGSVTVNPDGSVQILAEEATDVANLDANAAKEGLTAAQSALNASADEKERAERNIEIEAYESILKAVN